MISGPIRIAAFIFVAVLSVLPAWAQAGAGTLIVLNKTSNSASFIDLESGKTVATLPTGNGPHEAAVSPDGKQALVCNYGTGGAPGNTLMLLDIVSASLLETFDLGEHGQPHGIWWFDPEQVFVTTEGSGSLIRFDPTKGEVTGVYGTDQLVSHMVAVAPDRGRAYVANIASGSMTAIDLKAGKRLQNVPTGAGAEGIDITPDGREVWVTNRSADTISIVDGKSLEVIETLETASFPIRVKITPDGAHALVTCARAGELGVYDVKTRKELARVATSASLLAGDKAEPPVPIGVLVPAHGKTAFVANSRHNQVVEIDVATWTVGRVFETEKTPDGLGWSPLRVEKGAGASNN